MNTTPLGNRVHIGIFGKTNAGKSSLLNAITEQNIALVSEVRGTTTDPVKKSMELLPFGPVTFIDTAGLDDTGVLGPLREAKTKAMLAQIDFAILLHTAEDVDISFETNLCRSFKTFSIPFIKVITKIDLLEEGALRLLKAQYEEAYVLISEKDRSSILNLKSLLIDRLSEREEEETLLGDLLPYGAHVLLVVPIDSEAPKGRLILPQVQLIRDALDHGIHCHVVRDTELESALNALPHIDLVVTDSQAFGAVSQKVPEEIPLTGFSILFARQKGDLPTFKEGIQALENLPPSAHILIAETCTHNTSHEDIGRVKIPALLRRKLGEDLHFQFFQGQDYPQDLARYDLIIHCGGCMITRKQMHNRIRQATDRQIPIVNYGIVLSWGAQVLTRALLPFEREMKKIL